MEALEKCIVRKYLLENKERGIMTSEFLKGRNVSSSIFSLRRASLNNIHIGESKFFLFRTLY
jgi:hypothetical protein